MTHYTSWCYADGMTKYLSARGVKIFDFTKFVQPLTERSKPISEALAAAAGLTIDYIRKKNFRKEDKIKAVLPSAASSLDWCGYFRRWSPAPPIGPGTTSGQPPDLPALRRWQVPTYYFYFIDQELGLCYVRVPTWCPFRLQFYCNGHNWLAWLLDRHKIGYRMLDNAFLEIDDWSKAQQLAADWKPERLHRRLDEFAQRYCPMLSQIGVEYHWSLDTAEYATDVVFRRQTDLQAFTEN